MLSLFILSDFKLNLSYVLLIIVFTNMLENHCTRMAQSSCVVCSRRVHRIVYQAVKKCNFGQCFTSENIHR